MNINHFQTLSELLPYSGYCLSTEESLLIGNSLKIIQDEQKLNGIYFWGKIYTLGHDYLIASGYKQDCLRQRQFFYSQNGYEWSLVPVAREELFKPSIFCESLFQGDPGFISHVEMEPKFKKVDDEMIQEPKGNAIKLKEELRLACVIQMISDEAWVIPKGSLHSVIDGKIAFNPVFSGLDRNAAKVLSNYQLYRKPKFEFDENLLKHKMYNYSTDFLDSLTSIVPENKSFSMTWERGDQLVLLRSLHWPGAMFMHEVETSNHLFAYFGDGKMNRHVLFMT